MQPVFSSKDLLNTYARQLSADKGINMESVGASKYNDLGWGLLDLFVYGLTFGKVDLRNDNDFSSERGVLEKMNEATYSRLNNQSNLHKTNYCHVILNMAGQQGQVMQIKQAHQGWAKGLELSIGRDSVFVAGLTFESLKEKLEQQTTVHSFSRSVSGGLDNPVLLAQGLAKTRTVTGAPVVSAQKTVNGRAGNFVVPTIERKDLPPSVPGVAIHIGNNYIAGPNKLQYVDDGATVAYVGDMAVMTVVDGWGPCAKHECSGVHSAVISTAALHTMKEYREGHIGDTDLKTHFTNQLKLLYQSVPMPDGDTGVTFAGGVTYLDQNENLKLFSFGLSSAMFVSVADDDSVAHYHVQKETKGKPFVSSYEFKDLDNLCKVGLHDVSANTTGFKLGSDGCFLEYCKRVPGDYDPTQEVLDLTCKNLPKHGEISSNFTDEDRLRANYQSHAEQLDAAYTKCESALVVPALIAVELNITPPGKALDQNSADFWSALEKLDENTLPDNLKMPGIDTVNQLQEELVILSEFEKAGVGPGTSLSEFIQVVTTQEGDHDVKSLQLKEEMNAGEQGQLLLSICEMALNKRPGIIKMDDIENGNVTVNRVVLLAKRCIEELISRWKTLIQEPADSDQEWRTLATIDGREKYEENFGKPNAETIADWKESWKEAVLEYNELSINFKATAGDDFIFVSVEKEAMVKELSKRKS